MTKLEINGLTVEIEGDAEVSFDEKKKHLSVKAKETVKWYSSYYPQYPNYPSVTYGSGTDRGSYQNQQYLWNSTVTSALDPNYKL